MNLTWGAVRFSGIIQLCENICLLSSCACLHPKFFLGRCDFDLFQLSSINNSIIIMTSYKQICILQVVKWFSGAVKFLLYPISSHLMWIDLVIPYYRSHNFPPNLFKSISNVRCKGSVSSMLCALIKK